MFRLLKSLGWMALVILLVNVAVLLLVRDRPLPAGLNMDLGPYAVAEDDIQLLWDKTAYDTGLDERVYDHVIFDELLDMINEAEEFVFLDFFLWNHFQGAVAEDRRALADELAQALIKRKGERPKIAILVLTDPINRIYGDQQDPFYEELREANIPVVFTDLARLRDSNPLYSKWAEFLGPHLASFKAIRSWSRKPRIPNLLDTDSAPMSVQQLLRLLHFKANHRKVCIADRGGRELQLLVTSMNPADNSSAHSNIGALLQGGWIAEVLEAECDALQWSAQQPEHIISNAPFAIRDALAAIHAADAVTEAKSRAPEKGEASVSWVTEQRIERRLVDMLTHAEPRDEIRIAMFYMADRDVINAMKRAAFNGARLKLLLDANKDAFGRHKNGIPNRTVAAELDHFASKHGLHVDIRWADTHGEQFHDKACSMINIHERKYVMTCGSANWTRRNIGSYNMEANIWLEDVPQTVKAFNQQFDALWTNSGDLRHSVNYDVYGEDGLPELLKSWLYRVQEMSGLSTF